MAASIHVFLKSQGYRLITSRRASFNFTSNVKYMSQCSCFLNRPSLSRQCPLTNERKQTLIRRQVGDVKVTVNVPAVGRCYFSNNPVNELGLTKDIHGTRHRRNFTRRVLTDKNADVHKLICGIVIGKNAENIKKLRLESGLDFQVYSAKSGDLLVSARDVEVLNSAVEKISQIVQRMRNLIERVLTDVNTEIHEFICRGVIGKKAENVERLRSESGLNFALHSTKSGGLLVSAEDAKMLKCATESVKQEIERVRNLIETVLTDDDVNVHNKICRHVIGKRGENIRRFKSETGLDFEVQVTKSARILVFAKDAKVLKTVTEKVAQEVQAYRNLVISAELKIDNFKMYPNFTETVFTDDDIDVHKEISKHILGTGGQNIRKLKLENELDFHLLTTESSVLYVVSTDAAVLKKATAAVTEEVKKIKNRIRESGFGMENVKIHQYVSETVFTDNDFHVHQLIFSMLLGSGGYNLKRLQEDSGLDFEIDSKRTAILVSAPDSQMLQNAVELIRQEVRKIRNAVD